MNIDDLYKDDIVADVAQMRADLEDLDALQSASDKDRFHALFGRFASSLYHVTEKAEKFHGVSSTDRWVFIKGNRPVALCYEVGIRHKHGELDKRYLIRRSPELASASASVNAVYTIAMPIRIIDDTDDPQRVPVASMKPKRYLKYVAVDGARFRATEVARDAFDCLLHWLAGRKIAGIAAP